LYYQFCQQKAFSFYKPLFIETGIDPTKKKIENSENGCEHSRDGVRGPVERPKLQPIVLARELPAQVLHLPHPLVAAAFVRGRGHGQG
jgi:hypothetical protein